MLAEPEKTDYDLKFHVGDVPVRVDPWFWVVSLLMVARGNISTAEVVIWIAVVFVSILIHELGHAYTARYFGWRPRVVLYSFGGLAIFTPTRNHPAGQLLVSLAGPGAGFLLAIATYLVAALAGYAPYMSFGQPEAGGMPVFRLFEFWIVLENIPKSSFATIILSDLFFLNIWWGLVNLLPVFPLDGGQATRHILQLRRNREADSITFQLSIATAAAVVVWAVFSQNFYVGLLFGYLAFQNWQFLQQSSYNRWN